MRILLLAWGSRGDVQPFVALGAGLRRAGHEVTIAAPADFRDRIRRHGLAHEEFAVSVAELTRTDLGRRWLGGTSQSVVGELRLMREVSRLSADPLVTTLLRAAPGHDVLVSSTLSFEAGWALARATGIGHAVALFAPVLQTANGPSYVYAALPHRRSWVNAAAGTLTSTLTQPVIAPIAAELRRRLGLPRPTLRQLYADIRRTPTLLAVSPRIVPAVDDWPMPVRQTGYWRLPDDTAPSAALTAFVEAGPAPVYVGFGSMSSADPEATSGAVADAVRATGRRAVVLRGNADLDVPGDDVLMIDGAPHDWLLPRCAVVVGHGGAGTTSAALHAGSPQVVVPHMGDQPYWGRRVHDLGVGAAPVPRRQLTAERLAAGIRAADNDETRAAARALARGLGAEDGVGCAVRLLEARFG